MIDFIFMLTRQDQTVIDCLETFVEVRSAGVGHVGFKDVGVPVVMFLSGSRSRVSRCGSPAISRPTVESARPFLLMMLSSAASASSFVPTVVSFLFDSWNV